MKQLGFEIPDELYLKIRRFTGLRGESMTGFLIRVLSETLTEAKFVVELSTLGLLVPLGEINTTKASDNAN